MNKVILIGNLARDFELRYLQSGAAVGNVSIATNRYFKNQDGTENNEVMFIDLSLYGRTAEICNQYLKKGSKLCVEGRLSLQQWQDAQGNKHSKHVIIVEKVEFLDNKQQQDTQQQYTPPPQNPPQKMQVQTISLQNTESSGGSEIEYLYNTHFVVDIKGEIAYIKFQGDMQDYEICKAKWAEIMEIIRSKHDISNKKVEIIKDIKEVEDAIPF